MPSLGYDMETGKIVAWLKAVGDPVALGGQNAQIDG
jgi:pyruvate/2-oxoglutarate dehydrogenase complex dihydrolipoamide acyltransferase (E2) component